MKLAIAFLLALTTGCDPISVTALTVAPPGKTADLDDVSLELDVSKGIALGFECLANTNDYDGPCRNPRAKIDDENIAVVFSSYLDTLVESYEDGASGPRARTAFVVVGLQPGKTNLELITADGDIDVSVTVLP